jgi:hypothetical protein
MLLGTGRFSSIKVSVKILECLELVVHACNPSYSGGRDQEDHCLKPAQANSLKDPISKIPITKNKRWWSGSRCRP